MNNNKNSKINKVNTQQDGLNFVTNAKHKIRSSIHQGAQVLVSLFGLLSLGLLTSHRKIKQSNQPKQNRNILAPLAHVRFSPDSQQGLRHGLSCTRLCENLSRIGFAKRLRISLFCLVCSIFLGYGFFFSNSAYAASYVDVSSNGDGTSGSGVVRLGKISPSSTGTQATGSDTLTIHTDCAAGYKVYVSSQENQSTSLVNSNATTPENPSAKDLITAASNTLAEGVSPSTLTSNTWGINGNSTEAGNGLYYGLPSFENSTTFPLITMSNVAEESTVPIYYGVKVDTSINPGTYSGSVLYTVLINNSCLDYTVVFNPNVNSSSTSEITGTMSDQSIMYGETTALSQNAYTRAGYNFLGWSTSSTGKTGTVVNGIGTTADVDYADEADVLNLVSGGGIVTLYAIWELALPTMQNWEGCTALNTNEYTTLVDSRDGEKYVVKKLADGKCWMVQNLRLINKTITSEDSNVSANFTVPTSTDPTQTAWCTDNSSACDNQPMAYYDASTRLSYGALYNWYTATAGTGKYETTSGNVSSSICPKGWRLPTSGTNGDFAILDKAWGGTGLDRTNANTYSIFMGNYNIGGNGGFDNPGAITSSFVAVDVGGGWWSSTAYNGRSDIAQGLGLGSSSAYVFPQNSDRKSTGFSVRCITEPKTMQNTACSSLPAGQTSTLPDARDNQDYTIYRWPTSSGPSGMNGYCIMTKDLSLGYVTGGSITKDANLTLTTDTSAAAGTITARTGTSNWSTTNSDGNLQYINGPQSGQEAYSSHSYYSYGAAQKVCPKGWRLPTKAEYDNIRTFMGGDNSTGSSTIRSAPYNFVYGGSFYSGGWSTVGSGGRYWSSTQYDSSYGRYLIFSSSGLYTGDGDSKNRGMSVRCIAEPTMQSFDASTSLLNIGDMATLTDARDGEKYVVKRLPDGKVWMVQNLRLINKTITPADSNVSSNFTVPTSTPAGSSWCTSNSSACDDQPLAYYDASTRSSYGANYNWYTATAGTGKYETTSGNVSSSICPKGWRLPTGGSSGEFTALDIAWGGTGSNRTNANTYSTFTGAYTEGNNGGFDLAGYIEGSSLGYVGSRGNWWSSTAGSNNNVYSLLLISGNTSVSPQFSYSKHRGLSVRCVASS